MNERTREQLRDLWLGALAGAISECGDRPFTLREVVHNTCAALGCDSRCWSHYTGWPFYRRVGDEIVEVV
jgi:hypothetical protein